MRHRVTGIVSAVLVAGFATVAMAEDLDCRKWNTWVFFGETTVADVVRCLEAGMNPNVRGENGGTPLHSVASHFYFSSEESGIKKIKALVAAGADPNAQDKNGLTPLHEAVLFSNWEPEPGRVPRPSAVLGIIEALLAVGADLNVRDKSGETPLHRAAFKAELDVIKALLDAGADPKAKVEGGEYNYGETPLHAAAYFYGSSAVIKVLVAAGADPNAGTETARPPCTKRRAATELLPSSLPWWPPVRTSTPGTETVRRLCTKRRHRVGTRMALRPCSLLVRTPTFGWKRRDALAPGGAQPECDA